ncbi:DUF2690 domain-containing protein [Micromonospora deserti]
MMLLASFAVVFVTSTPAQAATCSGTSCVGKSPRTTGCDRDGERVRSIYFDEGYRSLSLVRSKACRAMWALYVNNNSFGPNCWTWSEKLTVRRQLWTPYGWATHSTGSKTVSADCVSRQWTTMLLNTADDRHRAELTWPGGTKRTTWFG